MQLLTRDRESSVDAVLGGKAHVGVAPLDVMPSDLEAHVLTDVGQMLVVPVDHALAKRRRLELKDLAGLSLIIPPEDRPHRQVLARLLQSAGVPWIVAVEAVGWELTVRFVQIGVGLAVVNAACTLPRGLRGIPIPALPSLRYHAFHRKGAPRNPVVRKLIEDLRHHANDWKTA